MGGMSPMMTMMLTCKEEERKSEREHRIDDRFRDRTGREHYDDGRFAPMRGEYDGGMMMGYGTSYPTYMGYVEPIRMGRDDDEGRRSWKIIENNGYQDIDPEHTRDGMRRVMGFGGSSVEHSHMDEMSHRSGEKIPGHASARGMPIMTREMAEEWMDNLQNADGSRGAHWTFDEVKNLMQSRGVQADPLIIWVGMNAEYSDSVMLNRKYGVDRPEYYLDAAVIRWLNDKDAVKDKAAMYYTYVVKH